MTPLYRPGLTPLDETQSALVHKRVLVAAAVLDEVGWSTVGEPA